MILPGAQVLLAVAGAGPGGPAPPARRHRRTDAASQPHCQPHLCENLRELLLAMATTKKLITAVFFPQQALPSLLAKGPTTQQDLSIAEKFARYVTELSFV